MKVIQSYGGLLIGINRDIVGSWSGNLGKTFVGDHSKVETDYDAAGDMTCGILHPPCDISKLVGLEQEGLLISLPLETAICWADGESAFVAQVHYGDESWNFSMIGLDQFADSLFREAERVTFRTRPGAFILFDASSTGEELEDDVLEFNVRGGLYECEAIEHEPDDRTRLTLCRISPVKDGT